MFVAALESSLTGAPSPPSNGRNGACKLMGPDYDLLDAADLLPVSEATFFAWKRKYGGMDVSDARRLKQLEH